MVYLEAGFGACENELVFCEVCAWGEFSPCSNQCAPLSLRFPPDSLQIREEAARVGEPATSYPLELTKGNQPAMIELAIPLWLKEFWEEYSKLDLPAVFPTPLNPKL